MSSAKTLLTRIQNNRDYRFPREELTYLMSHPQESIPALLGLLKQVNCNFDRYYRNPDFIGHLYAFYLLAQFGEQRAYPIIVDFFTRHGDKAMDMGEDFVTEDLPRVLVSICDGDIEPMKHLIETSKVNEWVRSATVRCLPMLVLQGVLTREKVIEYLHELINTKLKREPNEVWHGVLSEAVALYPDSLKEDIDQMYADDLVDEMFMDQSYVQEVLSIPYETHLANLHKDLVYTRPIINTISEMEHWAAFQPPTYLEPVKLGRNDPCHCGSGKKYKKCCWPD